MDWIASRAGLFLFYLPSTILFIRRPMPCPQEIRNTELKKSNFNVRKKKRLAKKQTRWNVFRPQLAIAVNNPRSVRAKFFFFRPRLLLMLLIRTFMRTCFNASTSQAFFYEIKRCNSGGMSVWLSPDLVWSFFKVLAICVSYDSDLERRFLHLATHPCPANGY